MTESSVLHQGHVWIIGGIFGQSPERCLIGEASGKVSLGGDKINRAGV